MNRIPSPSEVKRKISKLRLGRARLCLALRESCGASLTYPDKDIPRDIADTLIRELKAAGWKCKRIADHVDGGYFYNIVPQKSH